MGEADCASCNRPVLAGEGPTVYSDASQGVAADHRVFFSASVPDGIEQGDIERKQLEPMLYCEDAPTLYSRKQSGKKRGR
jgi:hypothetical protein